MPISKDQIENLIASNGDVVGFGEKIGEIGLIYLDDITGEPEWVTVRTGLFGTAESFVPLRGARIAGNDIQVDYDKGNRQGCTPRRRRWQAQSRRRATAIRPLRALK